MKPCKSTIRKKFRSSHRGSAVMNLTSISEDKSSIPGLDQWVKDPRCCEWWCRSNMWLTSGMVVAMAVAQAAAGLIQRLARELPYAAGAALKKQNK